MYWLLLIRQIRLRWASLQRAPCEPREINESSTHLVNSVLLFQVFPRSQEGVARFNFNSCINIIMSSANLNVLRTWNSLMSSAYDRLRFGVQIYLMMRLLNSSSRVPAASQLGASSGSNRFIIRSPELPAADLTPIYGQCPANSESSQTISKSRVRVT